MIVRTKRAYCEKCDGELLHDLTQKFDENAKLTNCVWVCRNCCLETLYVPRKLSRGEKIRLAYWGASGEEE